jgi:hypothetical protein
MNADVMLIKDGLGYRVVFGHLRLAAELGLGDHVSVGVKDGGTATIFKTQFGLVVQKDNHRLPLLVA